ncbi:FadR/GntR family transcriptional regulator [Noviherbaspirillum denitrificans]|uniref:FadR/GntR family transcriptional regulator n=1 Tax=Noviherbaspirillum denitrificans TaxID=1968433 RepID=UPI000B52F4BE|nr:FadR/GntR family transcriptional regulator [Noviherbaspirillum denitrificans]
MNLPGLDKLSSSLRSPQLYELVAGRLKSLILDGTYPPGARLPAERHLASSLEVGRATVREAIAELVNQRVIQTRRNSGSYVLPDALEVIRETKAPVSPDTSPMSTMEARLAVEPLIAGFAAAVGKRDAEMERLLDLMESTSDLTDPQQRQAWNEHDRQFHERIALMSGNPVMIGIAKVIAGAVDEPLWQQLRDTGIHDPSRARLYVYEHRLIYEAIATGNQEAARFYVRQHLERVRNDMLSNG